MAWFSPRKNEQVEQISRELAAIRQNQQALLQNLTEELRKVSKNIETVHSCVDRLHTPLSQVSTIADHMQKLQERTEDIARKTAMGHHDILSEVKSLLAPPTYDGDLNTIHANFLAKTQAVKNAYQTRSTAFTKAGEEQYAAHKTLSEIIDTLPPPTIERDTSPIKAVSHDNSLNNA